MGKQNTKYAPLCTKCREEIHSLERLLVCACGWSMKVYGRTGAELLGKSYRFQKNHEKKGCTLTAKARRQFRAQLRWVGATA